MITKFNIGQRVRILPIESTDHHRGDLTIARYVGYIAPIRQIRIYQTGVPLYMLEGMPLLIPEWYLEGIKEDA